MEALFGEDSEASQRKQNSVMQSSSNRLRVLFLSRLYPNLSDPTAGAFNYQLVRALRASCELDVVVLSPSVFGRRVTTATMLDDSTARHLPYFGLPLVNRLSAGFSMVNALEDLPVTADAILASFAWPDGYAAVQLGAKYRIPVVINVVGTDVHRLPRRGIRRAQTLSALRSCQHIYSVSSELARSAVGLGINPEKISVILNGIDPERLHFKDSTAARHELGLPANERILLYVGRIMNDKGVDDLLRAVAALKSKLLLVLVGKDLSRGRMRKLAAALGVADRCRFAGPQPATSISTWMNAADVFAFPSLHEGCPNVVLEALACGLPLVASNVGGIPEIVPDAPSCRLVPPSDVPALVNALEQLLATQWPRAEIARTCRRTWCDVGQEVYELLEGAVLAHQCFTTYGRCIKARPDRPPAT